MEISFLQTTNQNRRSPVVGEEELSGVNVGVKDRTDPGSSFDTGGIAGFLEQLYGHPSITPEKVRELAQQREAAKQKAAEDAAKRKSDFEDLVKTPDDVPPGQRARVAEQVNYRRSTHTGLTENQRDWLALVEKGLLTGDHKWIHMAVRSLGRDAKELELLTAALKYDMYDSGLQLTGKRDWFNSEAELTVKAGPVTLIFNAGLREAVSRSDFDRLGAFKDVKQQDADTDARMKYISYLANRNIK